MSLIGQIVRVRANIPDGTKAWHSYLTWNAHKHDAGRVGIVIDQNSACGHVTLYFRGYRGPTNANGTCASPYALEWLDILSAGDVARTDADLVRTLRAAFNRIVVIAAAAAKPVSPPPLPPSTKPVVNAVRKRCRHKVAIGRLKKIVKRTRANLTAAKRGLVHMTRIMERLAIADDDGDKKK